MTPRFAADAPLRSRPEDMATVGAAPDGSDDWGVATCGPDIRIGEGMNIPAHAMVYDSPEVAI